MARNFMINLFILSLLSGCFFAAKEITFDPDKGYMHAQEMEVKNGISQKK